MAEEDIELMAEFGVVAVQKGRLFRLIEEAWAQDAILDGHRLAVLLLQTHRAQRAMLAGMWDKGVILPVAGMRKQSREKMLWLRGAVAVDRYLGGEDLTSIRKELAVSISRWQRWWQGFKEVVRSKDQPLTQIQERLRQPPELIRAWLEVWDKHKEKSDLISRLDLDTSPTPPASGTSQQDCPENRWL